MPAPQRTLGSAGAATERSVEENCPRVVRRRGKLVATLCGGRVKELMDAGTWTSIEEAAASRDGHWIFVRWRSAKPPIHLDIYDLRTGARSIRFDPGFGGTFAWTPGNRIYHAWGCGTECVGWRVYDTRGRVRYETGTTEAVPSPDYRYVAYAAGAPPSGWGAWDVRERPAFFLVRDLDRDREIRLEVPRPTVDTVGMAFNTYEWLGPQRLSLHYEASRRKDPDGLDSDDDDVEGRAIIALKNGARAP